MVQVDRDLSAVAILYRLAGVPQPGTGPEPYMWQGAELPVVLQEYNQYLYPDVEFGGDQELDEIPEPRYALDSLLEAEECYPSHSALMEMREQAKEYAERISGSGGQTEEELAWLARLPQFFDGIERGLRQQDVLVIAERKNWHAGIPMEQLGYPDPPVWISVGELPGGWEPLVETASEFLRILLMEELSGGSWGNRKYHRSRASASLLSEVSALEGESGYQVCWVPSGNCALFLFRQDGELHGLRVDGAHEFQSDQSWQCSYLLNSHLKHHPSQERAYVEPFSLAGYCAYKGNAVLSRRLRGGDMPGLVLEPFEQPKLVREFNRMDAGLEDLSVLAPCLWMKELRLPRNRISDLSPLRELVNLRDLAVSDNCIRSLEPLAGLVSLGYLDLSGNPVSSGELQHLRKLKRLKSLLLNDTLVDDLAPLAGFRGRSLELTGLPVLKNAEILQTRTRLQALRLDLAVEREQNIGQLVPWLNIRAEYNGIVELTSKAYYE